MPDSDIRILEAQAHFSEEHARAAFKFGNVVADWITLCHVRVRVQNRRGKVADGWGAIFLSYPWAFRDPGVEDHVKDAVMRRVTERFCRRAMDYAAFAHPLDLFVDLEGDLSAISADICREAALPTKMPYLGALVCASPVDAAIHDAFGNVNNIPSYDGYSAEFAGHDLSRHLGDGFRGRYLSDFVREAFSPFVPIFHTVGGLDALRRSETGADSHDDAHPRALDQWIAQDGVFGFKIKLRGNDIDWDLDRVLSVYAVAAETLKPPDPIYLSLDANEQCESPAYMVELLRRLRAVNAPAHDAVCYLEQPTGRDMQHHRFDMRELSTLKPVFVDESLTTLEDMTLALELGWSGIVLKTCKCHSKDLLLAARAEALGIPYVIQDLTNPGIALLHSIGLAARLKPWSGVEANARQYYPDTSIPEAAVHPHIFRVRDGVATTDSLLGAGLGYQLSRIDRSIFAQAVQ